MQGGEILPLTGVNGSYHRTFFAGVGEIYE